MFYTHHDEFFPLIEKYADYVYTQKGGGEKKKNAVVPPGAKQKTLLRMLRVCVFAY